MTNEAVPVLDHGYVRLVETWGSDERIIEAARMNTDKGFLGWTRLMRCPACGNEHENENRECWCNSNGCVNTKMEQVHVGDRKLLAYLWNNRHTTPFEMAGMTIEVQAPIFVFREWHRHRTQSYNELSARYTPIPNVNYVPSVERLMMQNDPKNKQASRRGDATIMTQEAAEAFRSMMTEFYAACERTYQLNLDEGLPKELARLVLPVGRYSRMRASANLRNWLHFLTLRMAQNAQWEIRQYANEVAKLVKENFPRTYELFTETL